MQRRKTRLRIIVRRNRIDAVSRVAREAGAERRRPGRPIVVMSDSKIVVVSFAIRRRKHEAIDGRRVIADIVRSIAAAVGEDAYARRVARCEVAPSGLRSCPGSIRDELKVLAVEVDEVRREYAAGTRYVDPDIVRCLALPSDRNAAQAFTLDPPIGVQRIGWSFPTIGVMGILNETICPNDVDPQTVARRPFAVDLRASIKMKAVAEIVQAGADIGICLQSIAPAHHLFRDPAGDRQGNLSISLGGGGRFEFSDPLLEVGAAIASQIGGLDAHGKCGRAGK